MCNDYGNRVPYSAYLEAFSQLKIRLFAAADHQNLQPRDDIWPIDVAPIVRSSDGGAELIQLRGAFLLGLPKGPPVINMRSEGRRFPHGRCLVPASHFYEFTGKRSPKDRWRFTKLGGEWFCIAGIWRLLFAHKVVWRVAAISGITPRLVAGKFSSRADGCRSTASY